MRYLMALLLLLASPSAMGAVTQHWKLDDNAASTTVLATSGSNGTLLGGDNTSVKQTGVGPGGDIDWAFDLNGTDDGIDISASSISVASGSAWSVSLWFNRDITTGNQMLLATGATTVNHAIYISDSTHITVRPFNVSTVFTVPDLSTGVWHHLLVTKTTGDSVRVFVDGVESSTGALSNTATFIPNRIGRSSTNFFDGKISQVRVYDSDEAANVATLYAEGVDVPPSDPPTDLPYVQFPDTRPGLIIGSGAPL